MRRRIAEAHMVEHDIAAGGPHRFRLRRVRHRRPDRHDFLEAVKSCHPALVHLCKDRQAEHRLHEDIHIEKKSHEIGKCQRARSDHEAPARSTAT